MPIQAVIAFTKNAAQFTQDAAVAGGQLNTPGAAFAAIRAVEAACAAYTHAHADLALLLNDPGSSLDETAHNLSDLATGAARAAKSVARSSAHGDRGVAWLAASEARQAANAALIAADAAETDVTDPSSPLAREAAQQVMSQAIAQADVQTDPDLHWITEALRRSTLTDDWGEGGFSF